MKNITQKMLETLVQKLQSSRKPAAPQTKMPSAMGIPGTPINTAIDTTTLSLIGKSQLPAESPIEIAKLNSALSFLSSDIERGAGQFYSSNGNPKPDYWLASIWAIASLKWTSGKDIARSWSKQSARYTEDGLEKAWNI
jgi:hypothetical protein